MLRRQLLIGIVFLGAFSSFASAEIICEDPVTEERPTVWIDDVPGCVADETYCELYGMEYVCSDEIEYREEPTEEPTMPFVSPWPLPIPLPDPPGKDPFCTNGTQVLCRVEPAVELTATQPANVLTVVMYNIYELRYSFVQDGQRERSCRVLFRTLETTPDVDVIVFNEVFMGGCFGQDGKLDLRELLRYHGFVYTATVGVATCQFQVAPNVENGGVVVASRWPILYEEEMVYENFFDVDGTFFCKGAMYAKIEKTMGEESRLYHVFGTHLQAYVGDENDDTRVAQATELYEFMTTFEIPENEPVIYAGDLNADAKANPQNAIDVVNALHSTVPTLIGEYDYTFDRIDNDLRLENDSYVSFLDYVVYSNEHLLPDDDQATTTTLEVLRVRDDWFDMCQQSPRRRYVYPNTEDCWDTASVGDLSDHYAVRAILYYPEEVPTLPGNVGIQLTMNTTLLLISAFLLVLFGLGQ